MTPRRLMIVGAIALVVSVVFGVTIGAADVPLRDVLAILWHQLGGSSSASPSQSAAAIVWQLRLPRVVLAALVGSMLAAAGCAYQGTFRNPLADPYLLGVSAGAGVGATAAIVIAGPDHRWALPLASFTGAIVAVALTYALGRSAIAGRTATSLVLAGVAVSSMLTAIQTLLQQRNADKIREVYGWVLGRLGTAGWSDVHLVAPYVAVCLAVLIRYRRVLDVFSVGDDEAQTLGLPVARARAAIVVAASLGTAAAVAATGLIGFVGIIVPHCLRLVVGNRLRILLPASAVFGAAFLVLADLVARTALAPQEIPIGVVTALIGAPFFLFVMATGKSETS